jgi:hypothetical protein
MGRERAPLSLSPFFSHFANEVKTSESYEESREAKNDTKMPPPEEGSCNKWTAARK